MSDTLSGKSLAELEELIDVINSKTLSSSQFQRLDINSLVHTLIKALHNTIIDKTYVKEPNFLKRLLTAIEFIFESTPSLLNEINKRTKRLIYQSFILQLVDYLDIQDDRVRNDIKECIIFVINLIVCKLAVNFGFKKALNYFLIEEFEQALNRLFKNIANIDASPFFNQLIKQVHFFTILNDFDLRDKLLINLTHDLKFDSYKRKIWYLLSELENTNITDSLKSLLVVNFYQNLIIDNITSLQHLTFFQNLMNDLIHDLTLFNYPLLVKTISVQLINLYDFCKSRGFLNHFQSVINIQNSITYLEKNNQENNLFKANFMKIFVLLKQKNNEILNENEKILISVPFDDQDLEKLRIVAIKPDIDCQQEFKLLSQALNINISAFNLNQWINLLYNQLSSQPDILSDKILCLNIINTLGNFSCILSNNFNSKTKFCSKCSNLNNSNYADILKSRILPNQFQDRLQYMKLIKVVEMITESSFIKDELVLTLNLLITIFKIFSAFTTGKISQKDKLFDFLSLCFVSNTREIRLLASKILPLYLIEHEEIATKELNVINDFNFECILNLLNTVNFNINLYLAEATIKLWSELAVFCYSDKLNLILLKLIDFIGSSNNFHSYLSFHYLKVTALLKKKTTYKLLSPYMPIISLIAIKQMNSKPEILKRVSALIEVDAKHIMLRNEQFVLPFVLTWYKFDIFNEYSKITEETKGQLIQNNLDKIIANYLTLTVSEKKDKGITVQDPKDVNQKKFSAILGNIAYEYKHKLIEDLQYNSIVVTWEILKCYSEDESNDEVIKNCLIIVSKLDFRSDFREKGSLIRELEGQDILKLYLKKYMLGIVQKFSELVHDIQGIKPLLEKVASIRAIKILIKLSGNIVLSSVAQILTCLQGLSEIPDLEVESLSCWEFLIANIKSTDSSFIYDLTISFLLQKWSTLPYRSKTICERILKRIYNDPKVIIEKNSSYLFSIPYNSELCNILDSNLLSTYLNRVQLNSSDGFNLFVDIGKRLDSDNKYIVKQALFDLFNFLDRYQENFHSTSINKPKYLVAIPLVINCLLDTSCKFRLDDDINLICARVLGLVGSLDSNRFENQSQDSQVVNVSNFKNVTDVSVFLLSFIEDILVKAFVAATDPVKQLFIAYAIQEFLKELGLSEKNIASKSEFDKHFHILWNSFKPDSKSTIFNLLNSKYQIKVNNAKDRMTYPIFREFRSYTGWMRSFTLDLLKACSSLDCFGKNIFRICSTIIKDQDISICKFILPYAALNLMVYNINDTEYRDLIKMEILSVLSTPLSEAHSNSVDDIKLCYQTVFSILDYLKKWCSKSKISARAKKESRLDRRVRTVEIFLDEIPQDLMAKRSSEAGSYERSILYLEQCYRSGDLDDENKVGDLNIVSTVQSMYSSIDDIDAVQGILQKFSTRKLEDKLLEFQYSENWMVAQESFQALTFQTDERKNFVSNTKLLESLTNNELHDEVLSKLSSKINHSNYFAVPKEWLSMGLEASIYSGRIEDLRKWVFITESVRDFHDKSALANYQIAKSLIFLSQNDTNKSVASLNKAYLLMGSSLPHSKDTSLTRIKPLLNQLHIICDLKQICSFSKDRKDSGILNTRLKNVSDDFHSRWHILNIHKAAGLLMSDQGNHYDVSRIYSECSRIARKHNRLDLSTKSIMKSILLNAQDSELEYSKLLWARGEQTKAIKSISILRKSFAKSQLNKLHPNERRNYAEKQLKYAKWLDFSDNSSSNVIIDEYMKAINLDVVWEKPYFYLGKYYNKILDSQKSKSDYIRDPTFGEIEKNIILNYLKAISCGIKYLNEALPKIIYIWLDFADKYKIIPTTKAKESHSANLLMQKRSKYFKEIQVAIIEKIDLIPAYSFYTAFSQILSRICHDEESARNILVDIAVHITTTYPKHALWSVLAQKNSNNRKRSEQGSQILDNVKTRLSSNESHKGTISDAVSLFSNLYRLTKETVTGKKSRLSVRTDFGLKFDPCGSLVVPSNSNFQATLPSNSQNLKSHRPFPTTSEITFRKIDDQIEVLPSMQRPRRVFITGSDGKLYSILCKPNDDLRKDAKFMEFVSLLDHLLKRDYESEKRKLSISTYAVVPLNESYGIIEWVDNVRPMRSIITYYNSIFGRSYDIEEARQKLDVRLAPETKVKNFVQYRKKYPPVLYNWLIESFPDPSTWYTARNTYTRSCAVMSIVGYIIGLGDRHGENILFQENSGALLHVDFDCLFEKGKKLAVPETVPFRLTENMTDAMGLSGVEGTFRKSCEVTMALLRADESKLMNVLESFIHDPIIEWEKNKGKSDSKNVTAQYAFERIRKKIRGILDKDGLPVSIQAQTEAVIQQATSVDNLALMFIGWMAFS